MMIQRTANVRSAAPLTCTFPVPLSTTSVHYILDILQKGSRRDCITSLASRHQTKVDLPLITNSLTVRQTLASTSPRIVILTSPTHSTHSTRCLTKATAIAYTYSSLLRITQFTPIPPISTLAPSYPTSSRGRLPTQLLAHRCLAQHAHILECGLQRLQDTARPCGACLYFRPAPLHARNIRDVGFCQGIRPAQFQLPGRLPRDISNTTAHRGQG